MKLLIAAPTPEELAPLRNQKNSLPEGVDFLTTGVGSTPSAVALCRHFATHETDMVIAAGICGSLSPALKIGQTVIVHTDSFSDLGIDDNGSFVPVHEIGLIEPDEPPFRSGLLRSGGYPTVEALEQITRVTGATINTVLGSEEAIKSFRQNHHADIITMEGAGIVYACLHHQIPVMHLRAISNFVTPRNKADWDVDSAVNSLNQLLGKLIPEIIALPPMLKFMLK